MPDLPVRKKREKLQPTHQPPMVLLAGHHLAVNRKGHQVYKAHLTQLLG